MLLDGREYKCESCDIKSWLNQHIVLEIHHIDGNWKNNLSSNLKFLCPNCHSLTENYYKNKNIRLCECGNIKTSRAKVCWQCFRKTIISNNPPEYIRKKISPTKPTKQELEKMVWHKSMLQLSKDLKVSNNTIKKWCKLYDISLPPIGYWGRKSICRTLVI